MPTFLRRFLIAVQFLTRLPMAIKLRTLTNEEKAAIEKLTRSRTAPAREVERARIVLLASKGKRVPDIAEELRIGIGAVIAIRDDAGVFDLTLVGFIQQIERNFNPGV